MQIGNHIQAFKWYHFTLEINMHHLRGNAIPAGHVQYPLSNSYEILCR